jgi:hypothetical protein
VDCDVIRVGADDEDRIRNLPEPVHGSLPTRSESGISVYRPPGLVARRLAAQFLSAPQERREAGGQFVEANW